MQSIWLSEEQIKKLTQEFSESCFKSDIPYVRLEINHDKFVAKIYDSGQTVITKDFNKTYLRLIKANNPTPYIGCDEVGVGDIFAPVVVAAVFLTAENLKQIINEKIFIQDSKKMTDEKITQLAKKLMDFIAYEVVILKNQSYNKMIAKGFNSHEIKTWLHHQAITKLITKNSAYKKIVIDQYAEAKNMKKYSQHLQIEFPPKVELTTKAEKKYLAVAISAIIARYYMLNDFHTLEKKLNTKLSLGAGQQTEKMVKRMIDQYGKAEMTNHVKRHFKSLDKFFL